MESLTTKHHLIVYVYSMLRIIWVASIYKKAGVIVFIIKLNQRLLVAYQFSKTFIKCEMSLMQ